MCLFTDTLNCSSTYAVDSLTVIGWSGDHVTKKREGGNGGAGLEPSGGIFRRLFSLEEREEEGFWSRNWVSMSMKNLERDRGRKKGALRRQWRELGLFSNRTGSADVRAPHADGEVAERSLCIVHEAHSYKYRQI